MQAALGSLPADAVARAYPVGSPKHEQYTQWGQDALTTAVFEIIISGTLGCLLVRWLTPFLLKTVRFCAVSRTWRCRPSKTKNIRPQANNLPAVPLA